VKLLLDANLSPRLIQRLALVYPGSVHVDAVGLRGKADVEIWELAGREGYSYLRRIGDVTTVVRV
jgi:predicted nuclease of predicted toxin-antitoxin system